MRVPTFLITSFHLAFRRGENLSHKILIGSWTIGMFVAAYFDQDALVAICCIGVVHQLTQIQIAALRKEIRAKKMWHGGEQ